MPIDPSIITDTMARWQAPPAFDPLAQFAKIQALKSGIQEQQLRNLQMQQATMQIGVLQDAAAQRQRDLNDQQILMRAAQDPDTMKAITSWDGKSPFPLAGSGLSFKGMQDLQTKVLADQKANFEWGEEQRKAMLAKHQRVGEVLPGLMYDENGQPRPDADIAAAAPDLFSQLQKEGVWSGAIPPISGFGDAQKLAMANGYMEGIGQYAQKQRKAAQDVQTGASDAAKNLAEAAQFQANAADLRAKLPEDQAKAQIAQLEADFRKAHNGLSAAELASNQIQKGELGVKQAAEARQNKEFQAKYGSPESRQLLVQSVIRDPDSYFSLSPEQKVGVANDLIAMGKNVPVQLPSDLKTRAVSADLGLAAIQRVRTLLNDPDLQKAIGPISGRLGNIEQNIGDTFFPAGTGPAQKEQELRTNLATLKYLETKGLLGGRPASKMIDGLTSVMASPEKAMPLMLGSLAAVEGNLNSVKNETRAYSTGGASGPVAQNAPPPAGPGASAPALPARLSAADVGKTYTNKAGKPIRITAVNPADPTQFKSEEVK